MTPKEELREKFTQIATWATHGVHEEVVVDHLMAAVEEIYPTYSFSCCQSHPDHFPYGDAT